MRFSWIEVDAQPEPLTGSAKGLIDFFTAEEGVTIDNYYVKLVFVLFNLEISIIK